MYTMITQHILQLAKEEIGKLWFNFSRNKGNIEMENLKMIALRFVSGYRGYWVSSDKDGISLGLKKEDNMEMQTKNNQLSIQKGALNSCLY